MADIAGRPFLWWLLTRLNQQGVGRVILSLGYKSEAIQNYFGSEFEGMQIVYCIESAPLGTGGAMKCALRKASEPQVVVLNGDTYVDANLGDLLCNFQSARVDLAVAVARQCNSARYGSLVLEEGTSAIIGFIEKQGRGAGYVNAGTYCLRREIFEKYSTPGRFSFERDFLPKQLGALRPLAWKQVRTFVDIGVPEDYALAQSLIPTLAYR
jgi:D-glycero-alpha-D-manno-heptose 1-phosphate guanylyltransferase